MDADAPHQDANLIDSQITDQVRSGKGFKQTKEQSLKAWDEVQYAAEKVQQGGGAKAKERIHKKGRLTARERLDLLLDPDSPFCEIGLFAAKDMYQDWGGAPGAGVVAGLGQVHGRDCMIIANDATVKAGAFFPMTCKKVIRAQTIALENHLPTIYLVDSAGVFLPMQDEIFPDQDDFGRVFFLNARMSALGIPQIAAIMGNCVAGGAYLPVMCDTLLMTEGSGMYLAGPALVKSAIGQEVESDDLGGARVHAEISGTVDFHEKNDPDCLAKIRALVKGWGKRPRAPWWPEKETLEAIEEPKYDFDDCLGLVNPDNPGATYDMREIIARLVDGSHFVEYRPTYGKTMLCGFARLGGMGVGVVANQKMHFREKGKGFEMGGVIYVEAAQKMARFIMDCNQNLMPIIFIHDVNGFMVGKDSEHAGIIRAGAKVVSAVSNSVVPKISLLVGGSFGAGHYAMCGKAYGPRFIYAWPTARYSVMSGAAAAKTLLQVEMSNLKKKGIALSEAEQAERLKKITDEYTSHMNPMYGAARLWVDSVINPRDSREVLIQSLRATTYNPKVEAFNPGILQT